MSINPTLVLRSHVLLACPPLTPSTLGCVDGECTPHPAKNERSWLSEVGNCLNNLLLALRPDHIEILPRRFPRMMLVSRPHYWGVLIFSFSQRLQFIMTWFRSPRICTAFHPRAYLTPKSPSSLFKCAVWRSRITCSRPDSIAPPCLRLGSSHACHYSHIMITT